MRLCLGTVISKGWPNSTVLVELPMCLEWRSLKYTGRFILSPSSSCTSYLQARSDAAQFSTYILTRRRQERTKLSLKNLHKDVVFFHYLVEAVISSVDFVEPVIVNIRHHHLEPEQREQIRSVKDRVGRRFWYEILTCSGATPQSLVKAQHRSVTVPSLGTTTRYCEIKGETRQIKE